MGCSGCLGVPLGLVGQADCIYNSNVPGTKAETFVAEMKLDWISTIVEVQKTVLKKWDGLEGCSRRDGSAKMDVIIQKARLGTEGIMPCITSVKWGPSFGNVKGEESEVSCSGMHLGTLEKEFVNLWYIRHPVWTSLIQGRMRLYLKHQVVSTGTQIQKRSVKIGTAAEKCSKCSLYLALTDVIAVYKCRGEEG